MVKTTLLQQQSYTVRQACTTDITVVMQIEQQSFAQGIAEDKAIFAERLAEAQGCNYVLEQADHAVCGYFTAEIWSANPFTPSFFDLGHSVRNRYDPRGTTLYISSFALLPEVRGQRIAGKASSVATYFFATALDYSIESFPQLERIILLVHEDWHKAITLYETQGFTRIQTLNDFSWFKGKKAFIYEKAIEKN